MVNSFCISNLFFSFSQPSNFRISSLSFIRAFTFPSDILFSVSVPLGAILSIVIFVSISVLSFSNFPVSIAVPSINSIFNLPFSVIFFNFILYNCSSLESCNFVNSIPSI